MRTLIAFLIFLPSLSLFAQTPAAIPAVKQVAAGFNRLCTLFESGEIVCSGDDGRLVTVLRKVELPPGKTAVQIAIGFNHLCALLNDGSVACWANSTTFTGDSSNSLPDPLKPRTVNFGGLRARSIAAFASLTCVILENGSASCWGIMGNRTLSPLPLLTLSTGLSVKQISPGVTHSCAILSDNKVWCWGADRFRQLGRAPKSKPEDPTTPSEPVDFGPGAQPLSVAAGSDFTCVLLSSDERHKENMIKCFGKNEGGTLGSGNLLSTDPMSEIKDLKPVALPRGYFPNQILATLDRACALNAAGIMICWGGNDGFVSSLVDDRTIGDEPSELGDSMVPLDWGFFVRAKSASITYGQSCVITDRSSVLCWGRSRYSVLEKYVTDISQMPLEQFTKILKPIDFTPVFATTGRMP